MTNPLPPRRSARTHRPWWQTLLDAAPVLLDLPGTLGDLAGEFSEAVLDDLGDRRRAAVSGRGRPARR